MYFIRVEDRVNPETGDHKDPYGYPAAADEASTSALGECPPPFSPRPISHKHLTLFCLTNPSAARHNR